MGTVSRNAIFPDLKSPNLKSPNLNTQNLITLTFRDQPA